MADPLSLLRHYTINKKTIEEKDDRIIFGEISWPKNVQTNFRIYGWESKDQGQWEYYTLECLLYLLKNDTMSHPVYVKEAARDNVPVLRRPDRKELMAYLKEKEAPVPKSIDKSARLEMPTHIKRTAEDKLESASAKKPRMDVGQANQQELIKVRLAAKLDATSSGMLSINTANLKPLSEDLTTEKIAQIRAKLISNRRTKIVRPDEEESRTQSMVMGDLEVNREASSIFSRERQWRTRTSILQSSGKTFSKTVTAILGSVKAREDGKLGKPISGHKPEMPPPSSLGLNRPNVMVNIPTQQTSAQTRNVPYNRYDQEMFRGKDDTHGFNIETTGTFSGMNLKSMTDGKNKQPIAKPNTPHQVMPSPGRPLSNSINSNSPSVNQSGKRPSRTPIIIIPGATNSMITMFNAKDILQDLRFISTEDKRTMMGAKRENELLIQRRKDGGLTVPYRVIDNPAKLSMHDWDRVVAVFVMGQAWQFKGWPWDGNPTVIFSKIAAFHIKWDETILEKNIANWSVNVIQLSRSKRHLDRAKLMHFWEVLDKYLVNTKPHLRF